MPSFTKDAIKNSFVKLLNEKPFNKITVKDIVDDCGINRNSFYYHFEDIPSLLEEILMEEADKIISTQTTPESIYDCLMSASEFALNNKTAVLHIYNSANKDLLERCLKNISQQAVSKYVDAVSGGYDIGSEDKDAIVMFCRCFLSGAVIDWLENGMKYDLNHKVKRMCELFEGSMEKAFERAEKDNLK